MPNVVARSSAEKTMVPWTSDGQGRGMDEATLECTLCGRDAVLEFRLELLDDAASWRKKQSWLACKQHACAYIDADWLVHSARVIVMRCG